MLHGQSQWSREGRTHSPILCIAKLSLHLCTPLLSTTLGNVFWFAEVLFSVARGQLETSDAKRKPPELLDLHVLYTKVRNTAAAKKMVSALAC